jgi:hypothetical protein
MIDVRALTNEELQDFDMMMLEIAAVGLQTVSQLAIDIWANVLRELDIRGFVELLSGSYDDVRKANIRRLR